MSQDARSDFLDKLAACIAHGDIIIKMGNREYKPRYAWDRVDASITLTKFGRTVEEQSNEPYTRKYIVFEVENESSNKEKKS